MNKWIAIPVIAVLLIAVIVMAVVMTQQIGNLNDELSDAEADITMLTSEVNSLNASVSSLQGELTESQNEAVALQASLNTANNQIAALQDTVESQQSTIDTQTDELEKVRYPRHFATLLELMDWLQKDDTDTKYPDVSAAQRAFILEAKAAAAGYLLPVRMPLAGTTDFVTNIAVVGGDKVYSVRASDDFVEPWGTIPAMPQYPITPP
jgi:septal ring factor EnvC (AmiA/AmiB activator)